MSHIFLMDWREGSFTHYVQYGASHFTLLFHIISAISYCNQGDISHQ